MQKIYLMLMLCAIVFPFTTIPNIFAQILSCNDFVGTLPTGPDIKSKFIAGHPITDSYIHIKSANFNGTSYDPKCKAINAKPGDHVKGSFNIETFNSGPRFGLYVIAATNTWGPHESSYWNVGTFGTGHSTSTVNVDFTAPTVPGIYYIIIAGRWELTAANIMSGTSSELNRIDWNQGHDVASWDSTQLGLARGYGITVSNIEDKTGTSKNYMPADAIKVIVMAPPSQPTTVTSGPSSVIANNNTAATVTMHPVTTQPIPQTPSVLPALPALPQIPISPLEVEKLIKTPIGYALLAAIIVAVSLVLILITRRKKILTTKMPPEDRKTVEKKSVPAAIVEKPIDQAGKKEPMITSDIESEYLSQLEVAKRNLRECLAEVNFTSTKLQVIKDEHNSVSSILESTKKEIETTISELSALKSERQSLASEMQSIRSELSALKSERQSLASEMQSIRSEHVNLHPEFPHEELQYVKERVDVMKNDISTITAEMSKVTHEYMDLKHQIASARSELDDVQLRKDEKEAEIRSANKELSFIELELANVGIGKNNQIIKEANSMVTEINAKYEATKKELEMTKVIIAQIRAEYLALQSSKDRQS